MVSELETLRDKNAALRVKISRVERSLDYALTGGDIPGWLYAKLVAALR